MTTVSMRVYCQSYIKAAKTLFFDIPEKEPYDLRAAWLRSCSLEAFNDVVKNFEHTTAFGNFMSFANGKRIGTITVKRLVIHDARVLPSYEVHFDLKSGLNWLGIFKCEIKDLVNRVRGHFDGNTVHGSLEHGKEMYEAAQVFELGPIGPDSYFKKATCSFRYAGVTIGTATVKKVS